MNRCKAMLLLGPTGSGKTPLGEMCEERDLWGRRCVHFDFGASLRRITETDFVPELLTAGDMEIVHSVLESGALLENGHFHIARNIVRVFAEEKGLGDGDLLLMNGLPRHVGQAEDVDDIVDMKVVLHLRCTPEVVVERIRRNTGGDRVGRVDDTPDDIGRKLKIFEEQTMPLIEHYRQKKVWIMEYIVSTGTTPEEIYGWLNLKKIERGLDGFSQMK